MKHTRKVSYRCSSVATSDFGRRALPRICATSVPYICQELAAIADAHAHAGTSGARAEWRGKAAWCARSCQQPRTRAAELGRWQPLQDIGAEYAIKERSLAQKQVFFMAQRLGTHNAKYATEASAC